MAGENQTNFECLVEAHYQALYRFGYSLSGNEHDASDLVQETFTIFARKGETLRDSSKAKTWLFTTLYRVFLRQIRKDKRLQIQPPEDLAAEGAIHEPDPARLLDGGSAVSALAEVSEVYRAPLTLFYLTQFNYREIGEILDIPIGTVMSRLSRGQSELKQILLKGPPPTDP